MMHSLLLTHQQGQEADLGLDLDSLVNLWMTKVERAQHLVKCVAYWPLFIPLGITRAYSLPKTMPWMLRRAHAIRTGIRTTSVLVHQSHS